jgi:molecular chaperone DnaK
VSARDKATGKEQQIRIQASGGLSEAEIDRMVKEAEEHADEDKKRRELIDARNHADSLVYSTKKSLGDYGDKVDASDKAAIEAAVASLEEAMQGEDADAIRARTQELATVSMKLGEAMYKADQGGSGDGDAGGSTSGKAQDDVVDADFEEVDDDKKKSA